MPTPLEGSIGTRLDPLQNSGYYNPLLLSMSTKYPKKKTSQPKKKQIRLKPKAKSTAPDLTKLLSAGERAYIAMIVDPFNQDKADGIDRPLVPPPEYTKHRGALVRLSAVTTFAGSTATFGVISAYHWATTDKCGIEINTGGADTLASSPTALSATSWVPDPISILPAGSYGKTLVLALRVTAVSSDTDTSGYLQFIRNDVPMRDGGSTYRTYANARCHTSAMMSVKQGMTCRVGPDDGLTSHWSLFTAVNYQVGRYNQGPIPMVYFTGLGTSTVIRIEATAVIQSQDMPNSVSYPTIVDYTPISPDTVSAIISRHPCCVSGNSFKNETKRVIRALASTGIGMFRFYSKNSAAINSIIASIL